MRPKNLAWGVLLTQWSVADQFGQEVDWELFQGVPKVLVMAGKEASPLARDWGIQLQKIFNHAFKPGEKFLQTLDAQEKVKVLAVAVLPDAPGIFRGFFRSGFRDENPVMGLVLDFGARVAGHFGYSSLSPVPCLGVIGPGLEAPDPPFSVCGRSENEGVQAVIRNQVAASQSNSNQ